MRRLYVTPAKAQLRRKVLVISLLQAILRFPTIDVSQIQKTCVRSLCDGDAGAEPPH
jgi:hypothetical protein